MDRQERDMDREREGRGRDPKKEIITTGVLAGFLYLHEDLSSIRHTH